MLTLSDSEIQLETCATVYYATQSVNLDRITAWIIPIHVSGSSSNDCNYMENSAEKNRGILVRLVPKVPNIALPY